MILASCSGLMQYRSQANRRSGRENADYRIGIVIATEINWANLFRRIPLHMRQRTGPHDSVTGTNFLVWICLYEKFQPGRTNKSAKMVERKLVSFATVRYRARLVGLPGLYACWKRNPSTQQSPFSNNKNTSLCPGASNSSVRKQFLLNLGWSANSACTDAFSQVVFLVKLNNRQAKKPRAQLCLVEAARFIFQGNLVRRKCMWRTIVRLTPSSTSALQNNISMIHTWLKLCPTRKHLLMIFFIPVSNLEKTIKNKKCQKLTARIGETLCSVQTN